MFASTPDNPLIEDQDEPIEGVVVHREPVSTALEWLLPADASSVPFPTKCKTSSFCDALCRVAELESNTLGAIMVRATARGIDFEKHYEVRVRLDGDVFEFVLAARDGDGP